MDENYIRNEIKEIILYIFIGSMTTIFIPLTIGFGFLGFEESFVKGGSLIFGSLLVDLLIYLIFTVGTFTLIIYPITSMIILKRDEEPHTKSNPSFMRILSVSYIFSPEKGLLYKLFNSLGISKEKNPFRSGALTFYRILMVSIIIFWMLGILQSVFPNLQVVGVPQLQLQQVTVSSDVLFSSLIPAWSETMTILFLFFLNLGIIAYFTSKFKDKTTSILVYFLLAILIACTLTAVEWTALHFIVYGSSEKALIGVFIFGFFGSFFTLSSGTFIPFWVWHLFNNIYAKLYELIPVKEDIIFISLILWVIFLFLYGFSEIMIRRRKKKQNPESF